MADGENAEASAAAAAAAAPAPAPAPAPDALMAYDAATVPRPFGLHNTGVICHMNALLQALVSCSALVATVRRERAYLARTATGPALSAFVEEACAVPARDGGPRGPAVLGASASVLAALVADLRRRRPRVSFGPSQESASEGLVLLLDMLDAPEEEAGVAADRRENPVSRLFHHRYRSAVRCAACAGVVSRTSDRGVHLNFFHYDAARPATPAAFVEALRVPPAADLADYECEKCAEAGRPARGPARRTYCLTMAPEILVVRFNLYGGARPVRPAPPELVLPAGGAGRGLVFRHVAQVEHSGSLRGGHYIARGLRGGRPWLFNDTRAAPEDGAALRPSPGSYMLFYHYAGRAGSGPAEPPAAAAEKGAAGAAAP